ncbi:hypothetical protein PRIPAC_71750 [Pristionchus pacificus]|uniref:Uncharacterized protein n=1 Tax=Pristionchus pacificus TaxID=54126 RepID=A0A2A6CG99_PRIPA|nr:hypothetical protein PRIPAC_71750 [Pristionchus pacificus]|eukprot:PDM77120.1 hypothetical protein PRIPAC_43032 [Pristionchus pacificus]
MAPAIVADPTHPTINRHSLITWLHAGIGVIILGLAATIDATKCGNKVIIYIFCSMVGWRSQEERLVSIEQKIDAVLDVGLC